MRKADVDRALAHTGKRYDYIFIDEYQHLEKAPMTSVPVPHVSTPLPQMHLAMNLKQHLFASTMFSPVGVLLYRAFERKTISHIKTLQALHTARRQREAARGHWL